MIKGIGVDIALLSRFENRDDRFIKRILTEKELDEYLSLSDSRKIEYLAGRFAAKEAYYKAIHDTSISYHDVEIIMKDNALCINNPQAKVSISHDKDYVVAFVVIE